MSEDAYKVVSFKMTRMKAFLLGIIICKCGHDQGCHYGMKQMPCARCLCNKYEETLVDGVTIDG